MKASWIQKVLPMPSGSAIRLNDAKDTTLKVQDGLVWITEEGVDDDYFLRAGERYAVRGAGLVIVSAESDACIDISEHASSHQQGIALLDMALKITGNTQTKSAW